MNNSTFLQIVFFIFSTVIVYYSGKSLIAINDITSFLDFGIIAVFFTTLTFFINGFFRLGAKLVRVFSI